MKNLIILTACLYEGEHREVGEKLENVPNPIAAEMIGNGRAKEVTGDHEVVGHRDPDPGNRDPETSSETKPAKKRAKGEEPPAE